jgi:ADP-heptose:LPS heptosyltransferase
MEGRRILAVRAGALGDTLLALPALRALRSMVGASGRLDVLGTEPAVRMTLDRRYASGCHSIDRGAFRAFFQEGADDEELLALLKELDLVVSWSTLPLLRAKAASMGVAVFEASPHPPVGVHASEHLFRSLSPLGISDGAPLPVPSLDPAPDARAAAGAFLAESGLRPGGFAAIHPSSGSARKNWHQEGFRGVAERARGDGLGVLWIEGEADAGVVGPLERVVPAPVARDLPLDVLAAILAEARVYVGNDSGVTHLAAAVSVPTLALFGPTDPRSWAPRGRRCGVVGFHFSAGEVWGNAVELMEGR